MILDVVAHLFSMEFDRTCIFTLQKRPQANIRIRHWNPYLIYIFLIFQQRDNFAQEILKILFHLTIA